MTRAFLNVFLKEGIYLPVESQEIVAATTLTRATQLHCIRFAHETCTIGCSDTILL